MERFPAWAWIAAGVLFVFGVLFFFQTRDPMIALFGVIAAGIFLLVVAIVRGSSGGADAPSRSGIRVKCASCHALNLEDAKFCSQCGRAI